jgi:hypothetical protein
MSRMRHGLSGAALLLLLWGAFVAGQVPPAAPAAAPAPALSDAEMEAFLSEARVVRTRGVSKGVTGTARATLTDGTLTHDASIQAIDEYKPAFTTATGTEINFRDSWKFNVAAYRLDRLIALHMVPVSIERRHAGKEAAFTWWVDDVMMDEGQRVKKAIEPPDRAWWVQQIAQMRVFDQLIDNTDRNLGNLLITRDWRVWLIDHSRAFRWTDTLRRPKQLTRCDRTVLERMRALDRATLKQALGRYLAAPEIDALLARRDLIVAHFDRLGETALFDARRRP